MSGSAVEWREPSFKELWDGLKAGKFDWIHGTAILDLGIYPENGELLLIQLCASTESQALVKLLEGEKVIAQHRDLVPFIENTPLLLRVLGMCEPAQRDALLHFVRSLVLNSVADKTAFEDAFIRGNACAIRYFYTNLVPMVIPEKEKRYAIFVNAANMLFKREAYDEARVLYEHALENAEDEASCRWGILLCALYIQDVKEIAENDFFDPEMPEYRLLMRSIGNKEQKKQFEQLAQQNAEYQRQMQESHAEAVPERPSFLKQLVAWISKWWGASLAVLFLAFVSFFNGGAFWTTIWNRIPFVNGIGEGGIFYEIFSVFVLLAFVLNIGPALGMTTNITTLVRAVASSIYQDDDFEDEVPYSKCLRITMFFINAGSCLAVGSFGELFAGQTTFSLASGVIVPAAFSMPITLA